MMVIDTNILVRLLVGDEPAQTERAAVLFSKESIYIPKTVLLETEWVLRYSYQLTTSVILVAFHNVLGLAQVTVEDNSAVVTALLWYEQGMDFADSLHLASSGEADGFATFDTRLEKYAGKQSRVLLV